MIELDAINALAEHLGELSMADFGLAGPPSVHKRNLADSDENLSIGVVYQSWAPVERPQIGGGFAPTTGRYRFVVQTFVKASEREEGELWSAALAKRIRHMVYGSEGFALAMKSLTEDPEAFVLERPLRYGIEGVEFADSPIVGGFAYLSQTEFWLETELV